MRLTKEAAATIQDRVNQYGFVRCSAISNLTINTLKSCIAGKNITGQTAEAVSRYLNVPLHHLVRSSLTTTK